MNTKADNKNPVVEATWAAEEGEWVAHLPIITLTPARLLTMRANFWKLSINFLRAEQRKAPAVCRN